MKFTFTVTAFQACAPESCQPVCLTLASLGLNTKCAHQAPVLSARSGGATSGGAENSKRKIHLESAVKDVLGCPFLVL